MISKSKDWSKLEVKINIKCEVAQDRVFKMTVTVSVTTKNSYHLM